MSDKDKLIARLEGILKETGLRNADLEARAEKAEAALERALADGAAMARVLGNVKKSCQYVDDDGEPGITLDPTFPQWLLADIELALADHPGAGMLDALKKIGECDIAGYCISGTDTYDKAIKLVEKFYGEMNWRVEMARQALAALDAGAALKEQTK